MRVIVQSSDDEVLTLDVRPDETLVFAGQRQAVSLPLDCLEGVCGACKMRLLTGEVDEGFCSDEALGPDERAAGWILGCQAKAKTDLVVVTPALGAQMRSQGPATISAQVIGLESVAADTVALRLHPDGGEAPGFLPGQYARIHVPGTDHWRSYSYSNAPGAPTLEFLVRLLPKGAMSDWLRTASIGDRIELTGPYGVFFARPATRPEVMVAGGTGLGPMLSMLKANTGQAAPPATLLYGVNRAAEVACIDDIQSLLSDRPGSSFHISVVAADEAVAPLRPGYVTGLIDALDGETVASALFYLCGPPPMIEAARSRLTELGVPDDRLICERFTPSTGGA